MPGLRPLPASFATTRDALHRIAAHVLGKRRYDVTGRFGLRATPGGFGTPAFGEDVETLRVAAGTLVRERGGTSERTPLDGTSLRQLARFAGTRLDPAFRVGGDTPDPGDTHAPLAVDAKAAAVLGDWYALGWQAIDATVGTLPPDAGPTTLQLWPEHFDAGLDVAVAEDRRVNLGASPGDAFVPEPYLYVGPWGPERPGDPAYWNAPFGAVLRYAELAAAGSPVAAGTAFLRRGLELAGATVAETFTLLFVCTGNICRSPVAELLARARLGTDRLQVHSAGTASVEGLPPEPHAVQLLASQGIASDGFRSRRLTAELVAGADLVLTATRQHRAAVATLVPRAVDRAFTIREFARLLAQADPATLPTGDPVTRARAVVALAAAQRGRVWVPAEDDDIADPYGASADVYERCVAEIEAALRGPLDLLAGPQA